MISAGYDHCDVMKKFIQNWIFLLFHRFIYIFSNENFKQKIARPLFLKIDYIKNFFKTTEHFELKKTRYCMNLLKIQTLFDCQKYLQVFGTFITNLQHFIIWICWNIYILLTLLAGNIKKNHDDMHVLLCTELYTYKMIIFKILFHIYNHRNSHIHFFL